MICVSAPFQKRSTTIKEQRLGKSICLVLKKENLDEVIESINQELEKEAFVRNNVVSKLELRLEKLENESKKAAIEREQSGVIIRALAKKVDESINILQETVAMIAAKNMNQESRIPFLHRQRPLKITVFFT